MNEDFYDKKTCKNIRILQFLNEFNLQNKELIKKYWYILKGRPDIAFEFLRAFTGKYKFILEDNGYFGFKCIIEDVEYIDNVKEYAIAGAAILYYAKHAIHDASENFKLHSLFGLHTCIKEDLNFGTKAEDIMKKLEIYMRDEYQFDLEDYYNNCDEYTIFTDEELNYFKQLMIDRKDDVNFIDLYSKVL